MKKSLSLLILIFSVSLVGILPTSAQAGPDPTLVSFVQTAFKNTLAVSSLTVTANGTSANMASGQSTTTPTLLRMSSYQLSMNNGAWNASGMQSFGAPPAAATPEANATPEAAATQQALSGPNVTTLQEVILDGKTYIRYTSIPQRMETQNPPPNWTDTSTLPSGATFAGGIPTADQILALLSLPMDATSITNLNEGAAAMMDGMNMRVFNLTMNVQPILRSSVLNVGLGGAPRRPAGTVSSGVAATQAANAPAATQVAAAPGATPQVRAQGMTPQNTQLTLTVWIGSDNLVRQITSVVTRLNMGANADMTTTLTTTTDFTDFNQPVTISAPTLGS